MFIAMCGMAEEIQNKWEPKIGDHYWEPSEYARCVIGTFVYISGNKLSSGQYDYDWFDFDKEFVVWLPTQEQLQSLYYGDWWSGHLEFNNWVKKNYGKVRGDVMVCRSMQELWLMFIMEINFGKKWNGKKWEVGDW